MSEAGGAAAELGGGASALVSIRRGGRAGASESWHRAARELAPAARIVQAVEIEHPDLAEPLRCVNDVADLELGGATYAAVPFQLRLADDPENQAPRAEIRIDNVGRLLTAPIEDTSGGRGAMLRVSEVLVGDGRAAVEWTQRIGVTHASVDERHVVLRLGFERLLGRPAMHVRHDPTTSPGLF